MNPSPDYDDEFNELLEEAHRRGYIVSDRAWVCGYLAGREAATTTPENVECRTCGDLGVTGHPTSEYPYYTPCPHCTPDNVATPGGQQ